MHAHSLYGPAGPVQTLQTPECATCVHRIILGLYAPVSLMGRHVPWYGMRINV
jgi:hypothetical protein